jgi:hypothetical protein
MPRTDLLEQSAPRFELDQRSREARLRLEQVERVLAVRSLPRQSLLKRVLRRLGSRIYVGQERGGGTANAMLRARRLEKAGEADAGGFSSGSPFSLTSCSGRSRSAAAGTVHGWPLPLRCREAALGPSAGSTRPQHEPA